MAEPTVEEIVIIGSGPAGWTAAVYAARAQLDPLVFEGMPSPDMIPGGQLMYTTEVENYPGFAEGIDGQRLMMEMKQQAERFGARVRTEDIARVDFSARPFRLFTDAGEEVRARAVIVATGAVANWLGLEHEQRLRRSGGGVSACAVCDGALPAFRDRPLVVVGGGDSAMEEASFLARYASSVTIVHRRDEFRASKVMQQRVFENPKIHVEWNHVVTDVLGDDFVEGVQVEHVETGQTKVLEAAGLFLAIGHSPNTSFLGDELRLTPSGYIAVEPGSTRTSVPGVYGAGDVIDERYRQAVTAAGTGCMAALDAEHWLAAGGTEERIGGAVDPADAVTAGI
ncbi:MAG TPA: thioredoxin-disulfide reductase [Longimicrobiales bacterium]|nr:thioredoxin-disulfide reductase [Longimicrobiales bacterium]